MPRTQDDVENYLLALGRTFEMQSGTFVLAPVGGATIAVRVQPPIVEVQVAIGPVPTDAAKKLAVASRALELNASDLVHAAYAFESGQLVLVAALALENLDRNELEAVLSDIDMALLRHVPVLRELAG